MTSSTPDSIDDNSAPAVIPAAIVDQAILWRVRIQNGDPAIQKASQRWRAAHPDHELAWQRLDTLDTRMQSAAAMVDPAAATAALASMRLKRRRVAIKLVLGAGVASGIGWSSLRGPAPATWLADYRTAIGQWQSLTLEDGTQVTLNTDSAVDVDYTSSERNIVLRRGEICVQSASDPLARPLRVRASPGDIHAIGTRFLARMLEDANGSPVVRATLLEGKLDLHPAAAEQGRTTLQTGHSAILTASQVQDIAPATPLADAWTRGMLAVQRMRLDTFIAELGRYRPGLLRCDPAIARQLVTGTFPLHDTDAALTLLQEALPVRIIYRSRYWVSVAAQTT